MKTFEEITSQILTEKYNNAFSRQDKVKYVDAVWDILQKSYAKIGGLVGGGFSSKEEMIDQIPFWKVATKSGKVVAVAMYKDTSGRKRVAVGTDGTQEGKAALSQMYKEDFSRAYFEISGPSLQFAAKLVGIDFLQKMAKMPEEASKIIGDEVSPPNDSEMMQKFPSLAKFMYAREFGGHLKTKILLGTSGKKIVVTE